MNIEVGDMVQEEGGVGRLAWIREDELNNSNYNKIRIIDHFPCL